MKNIITRESFFNSFKKKKEKNNKRKKDINPDNLIDGVDYHGKHDLDLIKKYGYNNLNFDPQTPPKHR